jgi:hypothetical protein
VASLIVLVAVYGGLMTQTFNTELSLSPWFTILQVGYTQPSQDVNTSTIGDLRTNDTAIGETPEMAEKQLNASTTNLDRSFIEKSQGEVPEVSPRLVPEDDCLFNPSLPKCVPVEGKCPSGFLMNENEQCFPDKPCPAGFTKLDEDETGTCYPVSPLPTPSLSARDNVSSSSVS